MKKAIILSAVLLALLLFFGCAREQPTQKTTANQTGADVNNTDISENSEETHMQLKIEVNNQVLYADFEDNSSAQALKEKLKEGKLTLNMSDYGGFEKVGDLPFKLPKNDRRITTEPGDVILYQGDKLTVYYGVNTWEFTRVAKIQNADNLKEILGNGDVGITFSLD